MSYDVQILVNGNRCKQYTHNGKLFIEAKQGSEYTIEIKNNTWQRILAICSVDGLDILNGEPATDDSPGYVINGYDTGKFDGFRVSDDKVAKFVFDYKNTSYAASKQTGAERNVGVIGMRLFSEKVSHRGLYGEGRFGYNTTAHPMFIEPMIFCEDLKGSSTITVNTSAAITSDFDNRTVNLMNAISAAKLIRATACADNGIDNDPPVHNQEFDMGTKWGDSKISRVVEVEFEKGNLSQFTEIFYASRQNLIEMGVPIGNEKQVNFPESFSNNKYAKPPKNWKG